MPAPKDVKNNICCSWNLMYLESRAPMNEVPPANNDIATTRKTSISSTGIIIHTTNQIVITIYLMVTLISTIRN